jgi:hypothetical protein
MTTFIMPTRAELVAQLHARRRDMVEHFDRYGWNLSSHALLERLDRLIARYEDPD